MAEGRAPMVKIWRLVWGEIESTCEWIARFLPPSPVGNAIRLWFWRARLRNRAIKYVGFGARVVVSGSLSLGSDFVFGDHASMEIADSDPVYIGNGVGIARGVYVRSANHRTDDLKLPAAAQGHASKQISYRGQVYSIVIEDSVWVAANAIILTGAFIREGSVVSAGSVVSMEIPAFSIVAGNPARVVANRRNLAGLKLKRGSDGAEFLGDVDR